jgi:hypothetical protein
VIVRRILAASCLGLAVAMALCGSAVARVPGFDAARAFHRYPVYWAGQEILGMPLENIEDYTAYEKTAPAGWGFSYGSCELSGTDHPSCAPPLAIQVDSTCKRWSAELVPKRARLIDLRGAKAYWSGGLPGAGGGEAESGPLEIFTGRTTVVIFALERKVAFAAARRLRTVHQARPFELPPPVAGSLQGKLPCQHH